MNKTYKRKPLIQQQAEWDKQIKRKAEVISICLKSNNAVFRIYAWKMSQCSTDLETINTSTGDKLQSNSTCNVQICPVCLWRQSNRRIVILNQALDLLKIKHPTAKFAFLTFTIINCKAKNIRYHSKIIKQGWALIWKILKKDKTFLGYTYSLEVTKDASGLAHPHIHVLLMVRPSYFGKKFISSQKWSDLFKSALKLQYKPVVKAIRINEPYKLIKYISKTDIESDRIFYDLKFFITYSYETKNARSFCSGGEIRKARGIARKRYKNRNKNIVIRNFNNQYFTWVYI